MITLPLVGLMLAAADMVTHWPLWRWLGYVLSILVQCLAAWAWWKSRHAPLAVTYACPYRCGFLGDKLACDVHTERCQPSKWAA